MKRVTDLTKQLDTATQLVDLIKESIPTINVFMEPILETSNVVRINVDVLYSKHLIKLVELCDANSDLFYIKPNGEMITVCIF